MFPKSNIWLFVLGFFVVVAVLYLICNSRALKKGDQGYNFSGHVNQSNIDVWYSAFTGDYDSVKEYFTSINRSGMPSWDSVTPLHLCGEYPKIVEFFIKRSPGLNYSATFRCYSPFIIQGKFDPTSLPYRAALAKVFKKFINKPDTAKDEQAKKLNRSFLINGVTPLHLMCFGGYLGSIKLLVGNGVKVSDYNILNTVTPIHFAVMSSSIETVRFLLQHSADISIKDMAGDTPLHYAVWEEDVPMARLLIEKGANVQSTNKNGIAPSVLASMTSNKKILLVFNK